MQGDDPASSIDFQRFGAFQPRPLQLTGNSYIIIARMYIAYWLGDLVDFYVKELTYLYSLKPSQGNTLYLSKVSKRGIKGLIKLPKKFEHWDFEYFFYRSLEEGSFRKEVVGA